MVEKGNLLGEERVVLKRHENSYNSNQVHQAVRVAELDIDGKTPVIVDLFRDARNADTPDIQFEAELHQNGDTFAIPTEIIEDSNLRPGESLNIKLYEQAISTDEDKDVSEFVDSNGVIGRSNANLNSRHTTNVDCRLNSKRAVDYVDEMGGRTKIKFRNTRTGDEAVGITHSNYESSGNAVYFPPEARENTNADPDDLIEILPPSVDRETEESETKEQDTQEVPKEIAEMHEMITELYEAYLEVND